MNFSQKLQLLRKSRGITQEELSDKLLVSRQAVAKWESGQTYPDIDNLIHISDIFKVSVDYLVKDNDCEVSVSDISITSKEVLTEFLLKAKHSTYAAKQGKCESSRPNSYDYKYQESDYLYIDTYLGSEYFTGEEAVWIKEIPVYSMNYVGRVLDDRFSGDFLKEALLRGDKSNPYRGPKFYQQGLYTYSCEVNGDMDWYQGYEEIYYENDKIYECYFHGGMVR